MSISLKGLAVKKNWTALAVTAGLSASALAVTPAYAADPVPTGVTVAWKDSSHKIVRVTWTEDGDLPNKVVAQRPGGATTFLPKYVAAGAPNVVEYAAAELAPYDGTLEIGVAAGTGDGVTGPVQASAPFDTIDAGPTSRDSVTMAGSSTVTVRWKPYPYPERDVTPNDPLDLTDSTTYTPYLVVAGKSTPLAAASKATAVTVAGRALPYQVDVVAANEWGSQTARVVSAAGGGLTAVIPTWVRSGTPTEQFAITGRFAGRSSLVYLQARNSATSAWYTAATQEASNGTFRFPLGTSGSRHYRVLLPNHLDHGGVSAYFGSYSQAVATTVQVNTWGARFTPATVRRGQTATAELTHSPYCNYAIVLQRWTGKAWSTVGYVRTESGRARGFVKGAAPGRVTYRYYLPSVVLNGYHYAAAYSANFVLTTI